MKDKNEKLEKQVELKEEQLKQVDGGIFLTPGLNSTESSWLITKADGRLR